MKNMLKLALLCSTILFVGCSTSSSTKEKTVKEQCYDGVVYISESVDSRTLSVKFKSDGNVATETFDGFKCK